MMKLKFGIVGEYQSGKSLLINCLLKRPVATVGNGTATTHTIVNYHFSEDEYIEIIDDKLNLTRDSVERLKDLDIIDSIRMVNVYLHSELLQYYTLTDMPGFGYNNKDNGVAIDALQDIDYAIVVVSNYKSIGKESSAYIDFCLLQRYNIPYYFVLNCTDLIAENKWSPFEELNESIAKKDMEMIDFYSPISYPFENGHIPIINLMWYWYSIRKNDDELLQRNEIRNAIAEYELDDNQVSREDIKKASNFYLIDKIFSVENRAFLELKKEFKEKLEKLKEEVCPIGTIQAFAYNLIPKGWMLCDGRKLNPKVHKELFRAIGTTFGGDGNNYFTIPDLRGRFIRGWDDAGNIDKERKFGSYQEDSLQEHCHSFHMEAQKTNKDGSHDHYIGYETLYFGTNTIASNNPCKSLRGCEEPHVLSYGDSERAIHEHKLPNMEVREVCGSKKVKVNVSGETRPQNIALMFCIKVDSLGYNDNECLTASTSGPVSSRAQHYRFVLDWSNDWAPIVTVTACETASVDNPNTSTSGAKYLYYGNGICKKFYDKGNGCYELNVDFESDWGFVIRTSNSTWASGTKYGVAGSAKLTLGIPFTLSNAGNPGNILFDEIL